mmetsp:Transcript_20442/g.54230  ORF Transcript_20442/g.54230 Transcript_20442/m.54230 type:complete len:248 (+) Transcript_20442:76-819(+)
MNPRVLRGRAHGRCTDAAPASEGQGSAGRHAEAQRPGRVVDGAAARVAAAIGGDARLAVPGRRLVAQGRGRLQAPAAGGRRWRAAGLHARAGHLPLDGRVVFTVIGMHKRGGDDARVVLVVIHPEDGITHRRCGDDARVVRRSLAPSGLSHCGRHLASLSHVHADVAGVDAQPLQLPHVRKDFRIPDAPPASADPLQQVRGQALRGRRRDAVNGTISLRRAVHDLREPIRRLGIREVDERIPHALMR